jgi:hypothetical protein
MTLLDPRFWLCLIVWTAIVAIGADYHGDSTARAAMAMEAKDAKIDLDRELRRGVDSISTQARKDKAHAKATINSLRAAVRAGALRLSVPVSSCVAGHSRSGTGEARAELLPAFSEEVLDDYADADDAVLDLNECIDKYNAVRNGTKGRE